MRLGLGFQFVQGPLGVSCSFSFVRTMYADIAYWGVTKYQPTYMTSCPTRPQGFAIGSNLIKTLFGLRKPKGAEGLATAPSGTHGMAWPRCIGKRSLAHRRPLSAAG